MSWTDAFESLGRPFGPVNQKTKKTRKPKKVATVAPLSADLKSDINEKWAIRYAMMGFPCLKKDKRAMNKFLKEQAAK